VAYFSAEFGLHESLPIYSGGLGVLAGDHLKAASDLGIPLVGVGLMYRQGYFEQQLTEDGWQLENYPNYDFHQLAATLVNDPFGNPLKVQVQLGRRQLTAQMWLVQVGRVKLYLLDSDIPDNEPDMRMLTARLYGGDRRMRIQQEILLGIGGLRALRAVGVRPKACHMNEGHAAFMALERIRQAMSEFGLSYGEAREATVGGNVFTTHTPVPAGIDRFDPRLVVDQLGWMAAELGLSNEEFLSLGREAGTDVDTDFCMPILALRTSFRSNGVSCTERWRAGCGKRTGRKCRARKSRSRTLPTACTRGRGFRPRWPRYSTITWGRTGPRRRRARGCGSGWRSFRPRSCGGCTCGVASI
jgi:starch phosphorylase